MTDNQTTGHLVLIRHAESDRNNTKRNHGFFADRADRDRLAGTPDHLVHLTEHGLAQTRRLGRELRERFPIPSLITHSGYERTIQTMLGLLEAYSGEERSRTKISWSPLIRERHAGYGYEMVDNEGALHFPWLQRYWRTWKNMFATPPGGESIITVADREVPFVTALNARFASEPTRTEFIVTHGISIHALRFWLEGWDYVAADEAYREGPIPNCGYIDYRYLSGQGFTPFVL